MKTLPIKPDRACRVTTDDRMPALVIDNLHIPLRMHEAEELVSGLLKAIPGIDGAVELAWTIREAPEVNFFTVYSYNKTYKNIGPLGVRGVVRYRGQLLMSSPCLDTVADAREYLTDRYGPLPDKYTWHDDEASIKQAQRAETMHQLEIFCKENNMSISQVLKKAAAHKKEND